jgi:spore coat protein U-like protein
MKRVLTIAMTAALAMSGGQSAMAAQATATLGVSMTVTSQCVTSAPTALNFGSVGSLTSNVDTQTSISVQCTSGTPYNVALAVGTANAATAAARKMASGTSTVTYALYSDPARATLWGDTSANWVSGSGNGFSQSLNVYGRVPVQSMPAPGTYTDTVTVQVNY